MSDVPPRCTTGSASMVKFSTGRRTTTTGNILKISWTVMGFLEATANTPGFAYGAADATQCYKNILGLEDITRHVVFIHLPLILKGL